MNLLKALGSLSGAPEGDGAERKDAPDYRAETYDNVTRPAPAPADVPPQNTYPNVMASVLERHEAIANRIRNNKH